MDSRIKMWFPILSALVVTSAGALEQYSYCQRSAYRTCEAYKLSELPENEKEFDESCPIVLEQFNCMQEHAIECKSLSLGDITTYLEVLQDICRKDSSLHKVLARNVGCIKESVREGCLNGKIRRVARSYRNSLYTPDSEYFTEEQWSKLNCMLYAYEVTCAADAASRCGNKVKNAIIEVARRVDYLHQMGGCSRSVREEIIKDIPDMQISSEQELLLEELLLEI